MLNFDFLKRTQARFRLVIFLFLFLVLLDQSVKSLAGNIYKNHNFIFSLTLNIYIMYSIYLAVFFGIVFYLYKNWGRINFIEQFAWVLILAGAISNLGERLVLGYARDFIYIFNGILNLADFYIILGVIILLFIQFKIIGKKEIK